MSFFTHKKIPRRGEHSQDRRIVSPEAIFSGYGIFLQILMEFFQYAQCFPTLFTTLLFARLTDITLYLGIPPMLTNLPLLKKVSRVRPWLIQKVHTTILNLQQNACSVEVLKCTQYMVRQHKSQCFKLNDTQFQGFFSNCDCIQSRFKPRNSDLQN